MCLCVVLCMHVSVCGSVYAFVCVWLCACECRCPVEAEALDPLELKFLGFEPPCCGCWELNSTSEPSFQGSLNQQL